MAKKMALTTMIFAFILLCVLNFSAYSNGNVSAGNMLWNHRYAKNVVMEEVNDTMSEYEKAVKLKEYVCQNIDYSENEGSHYQVPKIKHSLKNHTGVCYDYATTYAALCREAGLKCLYFGGTNNDEYHSWNKVYADGVWYFADITQDSYCRQTGRDEMKQGLIPTSSKEEVPVGFNYTITERS